MRDCNIFNNLFNNIKLKANYKDIRRFIKPSALQNSVIDNPAISKRNMITFVK